MKSFGLPLAADKHVPAGKVFIFLGVRTDYAELPSTGKLTIGVTNERCNSIADAAEHALATGRLTAAEAARLTGRLGFATRWAAGRWGRAPMRPQSDIACRHAAGTPLLAGARASLGFFAEACRRGIPPRRVIVFGAPTGPAVRI
jgi:hypothetical protein